MAVSAKEDGATGERTLTRMTGATGATRTGVTRVAGSVWSMEERPEKMCGLFGLNHHLLEKCVKSRLYWRTNERRRGKWKRELCSGKPETAIA